MIHIIITLLGVFGVLLCAKIYKEKNKPKPLVCPLGADCNTVLKSDFSSFFGINLEVYGALYYGVIALGYIGVFAIPALNVPAVYFVLFGMSLSAFLFSAYLIFVQAVLLRSWCTWCLISASISTLIFICSIAGVLMAGIDFIPILAVLKHPLVVLHLLGFALGVGGATISDILFFRFLKDFKISNQEASILKVMSQVIWLGLLIAIVSGFGLYLPQAEILNESSKFLLKVVVVGVIALNGAVLNLFISPQLVGMSFNDGQSKTNQTGPWRKIAFACGAISFISWYGAFILGTIDSLPFSFLELLSVYVLLLILGVIGGLIFERVYCTRDSSTDNSTSNPTNNSTNEH